MDSKIPRGYHVENCASCYSNFQFKYQGKPRKYCGVTCARREAKKYLRKLEGKRWNEPYEKKNKEAV